MNSLSWFLYLTDVVSSLGGFTVGPESRTKINEFRATEIKAEIERKRRDVEVLERDLKRIQPAVT